MFMIMLLTLVHLNVNEDYYSFFIMNLAHLPDYFVIIYDLKYTTVNA